MNNIFDKKVNITVQTVQSANFDLMNRPCVGYFSHNYNGQIDVHLKLGFQSHNSAFSPQDVNNAYGIARDNYAKKL
jgi:hypothetical protein